MTAPQPSRALRAPAWVVLAAALASLQAPSSLRAQANAEPLVASTELTEATVYRRGALVQRRGTVTLAGGTNALRLADLERGIDAASVQLSFGGDAAVFALSASQVPGARAAEPDSLVELRVQLDSLDVRLQLVAAERAGAQAELELLAANRDLRGGEQTGLTPEALRAAGELYRRRTTELQTQLVRLQQREQRLERTQARLRERAAAIRPTQPGEVGRVDATVLADRAGSHAFELSYLVRDAGWTPDYDLFVATELAGSPEAQLVLVGQVSQQTGADWREVRLTLSTGDPRRRMRSPDLRPSYLGRAPRPIRQGGSSHAVPGPYAVNPRVVAGVVREADTGEPLIGASVLVEGTPLGVATDLDGRYRLELPGDAGGRMLTCSYTGYETTRTPLRSNAVDFYLAAGQLLEEVVVTGARKLSARMAGGNVEADAAPPAPVTFAAEGATLTARTYAVERPVTLPADGQPLALRLVAKPLGLALRYRAVPKLDPTAYLEGVVTGWDTLGLTAGAMRLHLDGRYLGQTYLDPGQTRDSLAVGLGADDRVVIRRRALAQELDRRPLAGRVDYELGYAIELRNTLARPVRLLLADQVPVSTRDEVTVAVTRADGNPARDADTGELTWDFSLAPGERRALAVRYEVSAPREVPVRFE